MNISLTTAQAEVANLKREFDIPAGLPYCLKVELWQHTTKSSPELSCHVSVFTTYNHVEQAQASNFVDALKLLEIKLRKVPSSILIKDEEVNIECISSSTTLNTPPKQS